jgi:hypothetical protein
MIRLALDLADGVLPCFIIGSDEFGENYFPQGSYAYDFEGSKHVTCATFGDKRQYTGNIVHAMNGELVAFQMITDGKTERSLPSQNLRQQDACRKWLFSYSPNHWSNLKEKKKLIDKMVEYRDRKLQTLQDSGALNRHINNNDIPLVVLLDLWPVNISQEFRKWIHETYPFIRLRYIPAGMTGAIQINDTYFHAPFKLNNKSHAAEWYQNGIIKLTDELENSSIDKAKYEKAIASLVSKPVLRNKSVEWNVVSLEKITEKKYDHKLSRSKVNLIEKGWYEAFGKILSTEFQQTAIQKRDQIASEETEYVDAVVQNPLHLPPPPSENDSSEDDDDDDDAAILPAYEQVVAAQNSRSIAILNELATEPPLLQPQIEQSYDADSEGVGVLVNVEDTIERLPENVPVATTDATKDMLLDEPNWCQYKASTEKIQNSDFVKLRTSERYGFVTGFERRKIIIFWFDTREQGYSSNSLLCRMIPRE